MNIKDVRAKFPQYQDLSDEQLVTALHQKYYSDIPMEQFAQKVGVQIKAPPESTFLDKVAMTGRAAFEGVTGLPMAGAEAMAGPYQMITKKALANQGVEYQTPMDKYNALLDTIAPTKPQTQGERLSMDVVRGVTGGLSGGAAKPVLAAASGGLGGLASGGAREMGGGMLAQLAAGLVGGMAPTATIAVANQMGRSASRAIPGLVEPFTQKGRENIAARAMQEAATDAPTAAQSVRSARPYVPGSAPTTAQAADDIGLALQEKSLRNRFPADFSAQEAANDAARQAALGRSFGDATKVTLAEEARDQATKAMRDAAFANAKQVTTKPIISAADSILKSGAGKREEVEKAMGWIKSRIAGETNPQRLYAVRQDINDIMLGKLARDPEKASLMLAKKELGAIKGILDNQLEKAAPGFKKYIKTYAAMSKEIDKAKLGQEITAAARNPSTERLSPAQFAREFEKRSEDIAKAGPVASDALMRVNEDLKRGIAPMVAGRAAGSDTSQNLIAQNMLARAGFGQGGPMTNAASRAMSFLYKPFQSEQAIQELLRDAYLNPQLGAQLLSAPVARGASGMPGLLGDLGSVQSGAFMGVLQELLNEDKRKKKKDGP